MTQGSEQPFNVREWRKQERARLLDRRRAMTPAEHRCAGEMIMSALLTVLPPDSHELIGCYWPFRREFNSVPYMREVLRSGGRVALPVVIGRGRPLEFRCWNEDAEMEPGVWNIPHPANGPSVQPPALIVPLVGFDDAGYRLGYGAGYYDATLAAYDASPLSVGVGFEFSRLSTIHPQPHDRPMNTIITEHCVRENPAAVGLPQERR
ncbi:MAG TPA: 5-formyltetrahydrofolate cyclo-ligase [Rhizomicrobium sp.]|jgi:5-formyltetrahydrofolate cyclo-ligase|nr:5-formyltetrahydrofolate cyclo-ligase [Rhizomicrobium sp.]